MLMEQIQDILTQKRKVDKRFYELEESISGRNVTDEAQREQYKVEERKARIKNEELLRNNKLRYDLLSKALADEEGKSKSILEEKLVIEQENIDLNDKL